MSKKRTYLDSYVQYGFDFIVVDGVEKPQCLLCSKVLGNGSLKPSILKQHLEATHPAHASDDRATFEAKRARFRAAGTLPKLGFVSEKKPMLAASYHVAMRIVKSKKPHDIAKKLIKPCALDMVEHVCGNKEKQKIQAIPLSNGTIHRRIIEMSQDICQQVIEQIKSSPAKISLQLDESCEVANFSHLLVFVRYICEKELKNEFIFCGPLEQTTKAIDIMQKIQDFFEKNDLTWDIVGSICTDGAPAMMGVRSGFTALVKQKAPHVITTHCVLHRHALAAKTLPEN
ncbi:protein ZBED8-like [Limulus polyphemus]|uniref:Protein ZBED8-like n=1 Tax=Limulus polyphemus TaxID=6850 RepID=A0ABM1BG66_LIMPO|nr:protein ZBED8-like [Limulus polyphemus]